MRIYNTLTRQKEEFVPLEGNTVRMYVCGPTVYNHIHIGNARPICVFDVLRRYLSYRGYEVLHVQNYTDVDDKIIKKANEEHLTAGEIAKRYIAEYETDAGGLNVLPATVHPKVTENMQEILSFIKLLEREGFAYSVDGDVYFRIMKFSEYGKLSHMPLEDLEAGIRVDVSDRKEHPMDFAVWKAAKPGEPSWESPWGKGRPGWHIECSAMGRKYLGDTIDIHCGGQDLIFPHHENEIAQSEAATGKPYVRYWMHNGYINIDNKKMSKSAGNFFTVRDVAERYGYEALRLMMIQAHYRSQFNYTAEVLQACVSSLERLYNCKENLEYAMEHAAPGVERPEQRTGLQAYKDAFIEAMDDDLNTADGLAAVFELVREINTALKTEVSRAYLQEASGLLTELTGVLGLLYGKKQGEEIPAEVLAFVEQRQQARKEKDFAKADALREQISALGYQLEETRQGTKISKKA